MALPEGDPGPILEEVGQIIRGQFGSGSPSQLIPVEGKPTSYTPGPLHGQSIWPAVWQWITDQSGTSDAIAHNLADALSPSHILNALSKSVTALTGFINLAIDYTATVAEQLGQISLLAFHVIGEFVGTLGQQLLNLQNITGALFRNLENELHFDVAALEARIANTALFTARALQNWATDNIFKPLVEALGSLEHRLTHLIDAKSAEAIGIAEAFTLAHLAPITHELTQLRTQVATLQQESEDCVQPMCEQLGPKTDLGKLLKGLNLAADALLLAELSALTEPQLVALINTIAAKLGQLVGDLETMFITDGRTIGSTITAEIGKALF